MRKRWVMLTCMSFLGSAGTSQAEPPHSPGVVYIDGLPCGSICQSYLAWSRKTSSISAGPASSQRSPNAHRVTGERGDGSKPATVSNAAADPDMARANMAGSPPGPGDALIAGSRTVRKQVTGATPIPRPQPTANNPDRSLRAETTLPGDAEKSVAASPDDTEHLVAIVIASPDIKSVSDLTNKSIAIDDRQSASSANVQTAIAAAGATEVQLSEGRTKAINRLISGEVPAAVLTLVYPEAAEWSAEIAGFKVFRIPLSPRPLKAPVEPVGNAAAGSNTRSIQEQVAAAAALAEHVTTATAAPSTERVALLMARPEIKSVTDLTNKNIAMDDRQSASGGRLRTAIAAAGATEVQLSGDQTKAIDRVIGGEVPAAILAVVSPQAAEWFPDIAGFKVFRIPLSPLSSEARLDPSDGAAAKSATTPATITDSHPTSGAAANSSARTILQQVAAATALAEHVTAGAAAPAPEQQAKNTTEKTSSASPNNIDLLVALVMTRPEIKSVSDLANRNIAIDDRPSAPNDSVRTAIAAAGAVGVQLSEGQTKAIDRLIGGEVPAAVLTLVSAEAAEWFPEIAGFRIFRIPLSPRSLKARL
jgi:TRAP-type uncharacterized transport system substrate-binding protein